MRWRRANAFSRAAPRPRSRRRQSACTTLIQTPHKSHSSYWSPVVTVRQRGKKKWVGVGGKKNNLRKSVQTKKTMTTEMSLTRLGAMKGLVGNCCNWPSRLFLFLFFFFFLEVHESTNCTHTHSHILPLSLTHSLSLSLTHIHTKNPSPSSVSSGAYKSQPCQLLMLSLWVSETEYNCKTSRPSPPPLPAPPLILSLSPFHQ